MVRRRKNLSTDFGNHLQPASVASLAYITIHHTSLISKPTKRRNELKPIPTEQPYKTITGRKKLHKPKNRDRTQKPSDCNVQKRGMWIMLTDESSRQEQAAPQEGGATPDHRRSFQNEELAENDSRRLAGETPPFRWNELDGRPIGGDHANFSANRKAERLDRTNGARRLGHTFSV